MISAIQFEGQPQEPNRPIGIDVATREFIRAYFQYGKHDKYYCVCPNQEAFALFKTYAAEENIGESKCVSINQNDPLGLNLANCLTRYDPNIVKNAWARRHHGDSQYSLCGISHSIASEYAMEAIGSYLTSPLTHWDALICPSRSIKKAAETIIHSWESYLSEKFGGKFSCPVQLPIIPLGVDSKRFSSFSAANIRKTQREQLGIQDDQLVILYVGRLNYIAKANPLPLLVAAEKASKNISCSLRIIFNGYFNDEPNRDAFYQATKTICNNVKVTFVTPDDDRFPSGVWGAGDIFCSLPDSIQESFGLTPIEAMAVGLPVIVSDWNGYKDTVRNGIEGLTIPTYLPQYKDYSEVAYRYFSGQYSYGDYLATTSQSTAVDVRALTNAITSLANNPERRISMGTAGKARVDEVYKWQKVIAQYEELWNELHRRRDIKESTQKKTENFSFHPSRPNPLKMFASYTDHFIDLEGKVSLIDDYTTHLTQLIKLKIGLIMPETLMDFEEIPGLLGEIEAQPESSLLKIKESIGYADCLLFLMTISWLVKIGICSYHPPK
ncbi:MAG: glycosyltransferase family 4 protein [Pseudomonadota bacterium]|nr:glycosyltransferase family 4 protein [Pseudomonadota bacterium]